MLRYTLFLAFYFFIYISVIAQKTYDYPNAPKSDHVDVYHGEEIADPYQWMENPDDPRLVEWLKEQNKLSEKQKRKQTHYWHLEEQVGKLYWGQKTEFTEDYEEEPELHSKYTFRYDFNRKYDAADVLYKIRDSRHNYKKLVDISDFNNNGETPHKVTSIISSEDHDLALVLLSKGGSDWREGYFYNLATGEKYPDTLKNVRNGSHFAWHKRGVFYDRYDQPKEGRELLDVPVGQALYYHELGTNQSQDKFIYQNSDASGARSFSYYLLDDEHIVLNHYYNIRGEFYSALSTAKINLNSSFLLKNFLLFPEDSESFFKVEAIDESDTTYIRTNLDAANGKIMKTSIHSRNQLKSFIPEYDMDLRTMNPLGKNHVGAVYRKDGIYSALIFDKQGELIKRINFPEGKKVNYFSQWNKDAQYVQFSVSSFYHPAIWYQMSLEDFSMKPIVKIQVPFDADDFETRYVKFKSKDGTEVPMYITCKKDLKLNGNNPTILYGYGGYGNTIEPHYRKTMALWLLHGGVYAVPNIRGGGAEGADWGLAGRNLNKQTAIDDFIAAAEYLIGEKYTNRGSIAAKGSSHGGMLVAAAAIQKPNLFKAVVAEAGPYDMLRKEYFTSGGKQINLKEYGSVENEKEYQNLKSYSPLHNIKEEEYYPNFLLVTGENDDRVPPLHSFKFLAALQEKGSSNSLYQLYTVRGAGHGAAISIKENIDKMMFVEHFLFDQLGLRFW
ncbi:prolyl oligopeptidase family serine peptidase [Marivirga salinae]|uniref:Prolyl oligopeptidase family serine peptidase n=1 Tax=Marivirga salinarum TaxID=3059078 RepID=A0AA51NDA2_9BACT|nr:prolyl oligopeptidase family serine peptidase [Marivirga sp. BDSF4-3]WMN11471.1 prolyl oligopeptidase family serine peptidase [Marivirga sp. BDSF4-3]